MAKSLIKVSLIESSKSSGHAGRGIGVYTESLKKYLPKYGVEFVLPNQNPDLIHYPQWDYLSTDWSKLFSNIPIVLTIHDVIPLEFPNHYPLGVKSQANLFLHKLFLNQAKFIITDSIASVRSIAKHLKVGNSKLKYIYLGSDPHYHPTTGKPKTNLPEKFALYIGDVNWNKNLNSLTRACLDIDLPLVIAGKNALNIENLNTSHPELTHIIELIKLWRSPQVYRLGYVDTPELALIMNKASVYCQVSHAEGFGLPALEALACGTPLVVSNTHSLPEICETQAFYCNPNDINSIKLALKQALATDDDKISKKLRLLQASKFSWDKTAKETAQVYNLALYS